MFPNSFMACSPVTKARKLRMFLSYHSFIHIQLITGSHAFMPLVSKLSLSLVITATPRRQGFSIPDLRVLNFKLASSTPSILYFGDPVLNIEARLLILKKALGHFYTCNIELGQHASASVIVLNVTSGHCSKLTYTKEWQIAHFPYKLEMLLVLVPFSTLFPSHYIVTYVFSTT